ncbi:hypothetical protein EVAR_76242_1 [Eumeta japonica]|uniref:Uncharacterized protein n=1 Tax=Eumeta variegata TaxID=151549 RepID=A0A4C1UQ13_EUMVA|nr:hypothetical protein EVAR_76242_1 [Eumeta japonica]
MRRSRTLYRCQSSAEPGLRRTRLINLECIDRGSDRRSDITLQPMKDVETKTRSRFKRKHRKFSSRYHKPASAVRVHPRISIDFNFNGCTEQRRRCRRRPGRPSISPPAGRSALAGARKSHLVGTYEPSCRLTTRPVVRRSTF